MAVGDLAGSKGLATYTDALLVRDVDTGLNQRGDDIAAVMNRADTLEAAAIGKPMFSVQRSSGGQSVGVDTWSAMIAQAYATPLINVGFGGWSQGALTIARSGVYTVSAHVQVYGQSFTTVGVQLVKNSYPGNDVKITRVDTEDGLAKDEWGGGGAGAAVPAATATATNVVRLAAGDKVRLWVLQRNTQGAQVNVGRVPFDLTMSLMWENN